jgi:hypothetical protein
MNFASSNSVEGNNPRGITKHWLPKKIKELGEDGYVIVRNRNSL